MKDETSRITWYPRRGFFVKVIVGVPHCENGSLHKGKSTFWSILLNYSVT